jgi:hypothetical protein
MKEKPKGLHKGQLTVGVGFLISHGAKRFGPETWPLKSITALKRSIT